MKSYTDINQSKKLAEILPHTTADGTWKRVVIVGINLNVPQELQYVHDGDMPFVYYSGVGIPSWSLAALLDIIPVTAEYNDMFVRLRMDKGHAGHAKYAMWYDDLQTNLSTDIDVEAENFIDACVEMIIKLNELNLL